MKCKSQEYIFNKATVSINNATGSFNDKCLSRVPGLKEIDFKNLSTNDSSITGEQANQLVFCIQNDRELSKTVSVELRDIYLKN